MTIFGNTARFSLRKASVGNKINDFAALVDALADDVDANILGYSTGVASARPAAGHAGRVYHATDTDAWSVDNGSVWETLLAASAWGSLGLGTFVVNISGFPGARFRREGEIVRLSGTIQNGSGVTITVGSPILTGVPAPSANVALTASLAAFGSSAPVQLGIVTGSTSIVLSSSSGSWAPGLALPLEGLTYPLS